MCFLKDLQSDQPKEARGQSWPWRSYDHSVKLYQINFKGHPKYLEAYPKPKILQQAEKLKSREMKEGWMKNDDGWMKNDEWRMMKDEGWMMKDEGWMMKDDDF